MQLSINFLLSFAQKIFIMKWVYSLLVFSVVTFASSCNKQPIACIKVDKISVEVGETVAFESCASDAKSIEWDFGDGNTSNEAKPIHAWTKPGVYIVHLRAASKNNKKADRFSIAITVKGNSRYLTKVVLKSFAAKKADGSDWDSGILQGNPAPDIFFKIGPADNSGSYSSSAKTDIKTSDLPFTWNVIQQSIFLSNQNYVIELRDDDSYGTSLSTEKMTEWSENLGTAGSEGVISLSNANYSLDLYYENR